MAKKKTGKGATKGKLKDESEEEKMARLKMEGIAAQEQGRRNEEASRVALRLKQMREQMYAHINNIKIHNQWRKIKRMAKVEELKQDIEIIAQNHEREVDRKDAILQMLDRDLEDSEEQYEVALRGHFQIVDSLVDLQHLRTKAMEQQFNKDLKVVEEQFGPEKAEIVFTHNRQAKDMQDMVNAMEQEFGESAGDARQEFESQREEVKNRNSEEYNVLKIQLEGTIEELERHFDQAHKVYLDSTEHRTQAFRKLTKNDAAAARIIERRMRKLLRLQEALVHWRTKISSSNQEWEERNRALRNEKDIMTRHYRGLKSSMDHFRGAQSQRLKHLSTSSERSREELQGRLKRAESILKLMEMCRSMETEQEKILPFCTALTDVTVAGTKGLAASLPPAETPQAEVANPEGAQGEEGPPSGPKEASLGNGKVMFSSVGLDENGNEVEEWSYLNTFFRKFNKVTLEKCAIENERDRLRRENDDLRDMLRKYLDGISVNSDVINTPSNTLLIVNQRLQITLSERSKARANKMSEGDKSGPAQNAK